MIHYILQVEAVEKYPPTFSLLSYLALRGDEVHLITSVKSVSVEQFCIKNNIDLIYTKHSYESHASSLKKMFLIPMIKKELWSNIPSKKEELFVWIMTSITLKFIGNKIFKVKYIMYNYELIETLKYHNKISFLKVPLKKIARNAVVNIQCEYNRAILYKTWFDLDEIPFVIPNKPLYNGAISKKSYISNEHARNIVSKISKKKIIIYQGIVDKERPLDNLIKAIDELGDEYAFVIMTSDPDKVNTDLGHNVYVIPFVSPPLHLEITSWAHIGILIYNPVKGATTSQFNSLYCAPNKLYEYSMFGIPMIGNSIPGLKYSIELNNIGYCFEEKDIESIKQAILQIEKKYPEFSQRSYDFYKKTNICSQNTAN